MAYERIEHPVEAPIDETQYSSKPLPIKKDKYYGIKMNIMSKPKREMEGNCYMRVLDSVLNFFGKQFTKDEKDEMIIHISKNDRGFNLRDASKWLNKYGIDAVMETNVSFDRLRHAMQNNIPVSLIFKAPFDFSCYVGMKKRKVTRYNLSGEKVVYTKKTNLFQKYDNHAVVLLGINERYVFMLDSLYKDGRVPVRVTIENFARKWAMEYDDYNYYSNHFYRVERPAIFFYAFKPYTPCKIKKETLDAINDDPLEKVNQEYLNSKEFEDKKIKSMIKEIRERHEFSKRHGYHDMILAHLKASLLITLQKREGIDVSYSDKNSNEFDRKFLEKYIRLAELDAKIEKRM